jgi:prephenate dehydrogenase
MPVERNAEYMGQVKPFLKNSCILTDVGSVKGDISQSAFRLGLNTHFIGGHPMAGSEKTGYANSTDHLLENAYYALTPSDGTSPESLERLKDLVLSLKAIPVVLSPDEHDYVVAGISHLPHMIASGLVNLVKHSDSDKGTMKQLAAGGFKDITRIASSSPVMWQQICMTNKEYLAKTMDEYIQYFQRVRDAVRDADRDFLFRFFEEARDYRNSVPESNSSLLKEIHAVYCDIRDETGSIAKIATVLAERNINIKNISITHNREFQEEALRVDFYDKRSAGLAEQVLRESGYRALLCS